MLKFRSRVRFVRSYSAAFSEALADQFNATGVVNEPIESGIGDGGISDDFVSAVDGDRAGDDRGSPLVLILDDLEEVAHLIVVEIFAIPVVV